MDIASQPSRFYSFVFTSGMLVVAGDMTDVVAERGQAIAIIGWVGSRVEVGPECIRFGFGLPVLGPGGKYKPGKGTGRQAAGTEES